MASERLAVVRDGVELAEEQARALWRAFSEHMERSQDDLDGFAKDHGFVAVRTEVRRGRAVLLVWSSASASIPPAPRRSELPPRPRARPGTAKGRVPSSPSMRAVGRK
jgi:hypothetical protein